jgi:regulator of protease activity HflC (stomatin/prohibitin superfamily)
MAVLIVVAVLVLFALVLAARTIRVIPQARAGVVERLGRYSRTLEPGLTLVTPFIDRVRPLVDLREQVVNFSPQSVITDDNVVVAIETVLYFTITDPRSATYEVANPLQAIEQLTVTTLRNVIGGLTLEATLTARENVNAELRTVLDEATGKWGIRINRVEIKSVDPPPDIRTAMEKQMRAERDRRAAILTAEGEKQSAILTAEGEQRAAILTAEGAKQAAVLSAEGERQSAILRADGEAKAIDTVFKAIHEGKPDRALLSYEYLKMLPELAEGEANKVFVVPSEFADAFGGIGEALKGRLPGGEAPAGNSTLPPGRD